MHIYKRWGMQYISVQKGEDSWMFVNSGEYIPAQKSDGKSTGIVSVKVLPFSC